MMNSPTYQEIVAEIAAFFNAHQGVGSFVNAQTYDAQTMQNTYICVILVPQTSEIGDGALSLRFVAYVCELLNENKSNATTAYNDTLAIATDFVAEFSDGGCREWEIEQPVSLEPFEEKFDDNVCGWGITFTCAVPFYGDSCGIPTI